MAWIIILAQFLADGPELPGGGAGWVGASMLGGVLSWLMFIYLPAKDKQAVEVRETMMKLIERLHADHDKNDVSRLVTYKESLEIVIQHCQRENDQLVRSVNEGMERVAKVLAQLAPANSGEAK